MHTLAPKLQCNRSRDGPPCNVPVTTVMFLGANTNCPAGLVEEGGDANTVQLTMPAPPVDAGHSHATVTSPSPAQAHTWGTRWTAVQGAGAHHRNVWTRHAHDRVLTRQRRGGARRTPRVRHVASRRKQVNRQLGPKHACRQACQRRGRWRAQQACARCAGQRRLQHTCGQRL